MVLSVKYQLTSSNIAYVAERCAYVAERGVYVVERYEIERCGTEIEIHHCRTLFSLSAKSTIAEPSSASPTIFATGSPNTPTFSKLRLSAMARGCLSWWSGTHFSPWVLMRGSSLLTRIRLSRCLGFRWIIGRIWIWIWNWTIIGSLICWTRFPWCLPIQMGTSLICECWRWKSIGWVDSWVLELDFEEGVMLRVRFFSQKSGPIRLLDKMTERRMKKCEREGIAFIPMPDIWVAVEAGFMDWNRLLAFIISFEILGSGCRINWDVFLAIVLPSSREGGKVMLPMLSSPKSSSRGGSWISRSFTHSSWLEREKKRWGVEFRFVGHISQSHISLPHKHLGLPHKHLCLPHKQYLTS